MAVASEMFNHLLHILPSVTHKKLEQIYARVPGSMMKHLNISNPTRKRVECDDSIVIDGKLYKQSETSYWHDPVSNDIKQQNTTVCHVDCDRSDKSNPAPERHNFAVQYEKQRSIEPVSISDKYSQSCDQFRPSFPEPLYKQFSLKEKQRSIEPVSISNKYSQSWDQFRQCFLESLCKQFNLKYITEVNSSEIGSTILKQYEDRCFQMDPSQKISSSPIRFQTSYTMKKDWGQVSSGTCYVDAYIDCQTEKNWSSKYKTKIRYIVALEFNELSYDYEKIKQFEEQLVNNDVPTVIQIIEKVNKLEWEGFLKKK